MKKVIEEFILWGPKEHNELNRKRGCFIKRERAKPQIYSIRRKGHVSPEWSLKSIRHFYVKIYAKNAKTLMKNILL